MLFNFENIQTHHFAPANGREKCAKLGEIYAEVGMNYEEEAQIRYQEMCRIVGDAVFVMVAEGHETKKVAIADVIRTELAKGLDKWEEDQLQVMELAVKLLEE